MGLKDLFSSSARSKTRLDKLIKTVTNPYTQSADRYHAMEQIGFFYGKAPVVTLDMACEAIFLREWSVRFMPPAVKTALGVPPTWVPELQQQQQGTGGAGPTAAR